MRGSHILLSVCLDDQFGVWSNRKTSNKSQTTSSEMRVAGNASSSYKDTWASRARLAGLNIILISKYTSRSQLTGGLAGHHWSPAAAKFSLIDWTRFAYQSNNFSSCMFGCWQGPLSIIIMTTKHHHHPLNCYLYLSAPHCFVLTDNVRLWPGSTATASVSQKLKSNEFVVTQSYTKLHKSPCLSFEMSQWPRGPVAVNTQHICLW